MGYIVQSYPSACTNAYTLRRCLHSFMRAWCTGERRWLASDRRMNARTHGEFIIRAVFHLCRANKKNTDKK